MKKKIVFHGTTERSWKRAVRGDQTLYLTGSLADAANYAYEEAGGDELHGYEAKPIVLAIPISHLEGLEFGPDWGWGEVTDESTWRDSFKAVGSFTVQGDVQSYKRLFVRVPKKEWAE